MEAARALVDGAAPDSADASELAFTEALLAVDAGRPADALPMLRPLIGPPEAPAGDLARRARLARAEALEALGLIAAAEEEWRLCEDEAAGDLERADVWQRRAWTAIGAGRWTDARAAADGMMTRVEAWIDDAASAAESAERGRIARGFVETALDAQLGDADRTDGPEAAGWIRLVTGASAGAPGGEAAGERDVLWFWGARRVVAIAAEDGAAGPLRACGDSERLREWILLFRSLLIEPDREAERDRVGRWLVDALFGAAPRPDGTLRLEPDGPLAALPFALLPTVDGPLGLANALVRGARPAGSPPAGEEPHDTLILADPAPAPGAPTAPLPGARREAIAIASRLPGARILTGEDATEARVAGMAPPTVLHVAAHSSADPDHPALFLAPGGGRDGRLMPDEVRRLPRVPRVVVLSSCESLLTDVSGRSSSGQVATAFLEAGGGSVVGALWSVEDRALGTLMAAFHEELAAGARPSEAMRRARTAAAHSREPGVADPFAWGAFSVLGRDEAIRFAPPEKRNDRGPEAAVGTLSVLGFAALLLATRRMGRANGEGRTSR